VRFGTAAKTQDFARDSKLSDAGQETVQVGIGIKPVSKLGTQRLVRAAIEYAIGHKQNR
jgi:isocitrate dehydrogenase